MLAAGWAKVYHPRRRRPARARLRRVEFMRRYFDEYRGLRETTGHVEPFAAAARRATCARQLAADRRWMRERGLPGAERAALDALAL